MIGLRFGLLLPLVWGGLTVGFWSCLELGFPQGAIAQTTVNENLLLEPSERESFAVFIARSEANAAVRVQSLFDEDLLRTEVRLTVLGRKGRAIASVLKLRVTRQEWTKYPDPEIWSIYYPEAKSLLNFDQFDPFAPAEAEDTASN